MCGIFGVFGTNAESGADLDALGRMNRLLAHRGPDGEGLHADGPLAIGMRRLSIIDLKTGEQPIANEDRSVWVVFNGEIYNYRELTAELLARGHRFSTATDTEVLVHLYEERGENCVEALRGMFAFAIWDARQRRLLLARDRLGIKPLYYAETARGIVFASELKAVVEHPWVRPQVAMPAVAAYLRYGYVPDPLTILKDVAKLAPGHTLTVVGGRAGQPRGYWDVGRSFRSAPASCNEAEAAETLFALLSQAVRSHLVSDVPLGAFLSGGVDSSAVVSIMAREASGPVKTFSVAFDVPEYNEGPYARRVAEALGTEHHELTVGAEDVGVLDELVSMFDEPFADASAIPTYLVSRLARQHVKVVLSGDGGDELFAGYDRYVVDYRRRHLGKLGDLGLGGGMRLMSALLPEGTPGKNYLHNLSLTRIDRYLDAIAVFPTGALHELLDGAADDEDSFGPFVRAGEGLSAVSRLQDLDLRTYLPSDILTKVDRMSMATSLEARVPFLDHPLVEFVCALPPELLMKGTVTKYLLRRVLTGRVPDEVLTRPKQGFGVPLERWFGDRLPGFFADLLTDSSRLETVGVRRAAVAALVDVYTRRRRIDHFRRLWALVVLDRFLRSLHTSAVASAESLA